MNMEHLDMKKRRLGGVCLIEGRSSNILGGRAGMFIGRGRSIVVEGMLYVVGLS